MIIGVPKESHEGERRVSLDPATAKRLIDQGLECRVESNAGLSAGFDDAAYEEVGARICSDRGEVFQAEILLQVRAAGANPTHGAADRNQYRSQQLVIGLWDPLGAPHCIAESAQKGVICGALEMVPRTTRAQSMDVLSSMATLAGYRAVLLAAVHLPKIFPLMMTAAGTLIPSKVFVIGAGVAGLQAIATAKRLGAVVEGYDVREAAREQVESVGGRFVVLDLDTAGAEGEGGYAKSLGDDFYSRQQAAMAKHVADADVVITTAAIPGKPSPVLVTEAAVAAMRPGSVIVDLAAERGGNCALTCADQTTVVHHVTILGPTNAPSDVPFHASQMFARNLASFLRLLIKDGSLQFNDDDDIVRETIVARDGKITHARIQELCQSSATDT